MKKELMKYMENSRNKISFGRSIYPNLDREVLIDILEKMKAARQCVAFTSFQLQEFPMQIEPMMEFIELTVSYGVNVIPDIAHKDLTKENILALKKSGLKYLRLDEFGDESLVERCGQAFQLVVNASTFKKEEMLVLQKLRLNTQIIACHNYYPKEYTGISIKKLEKMNAYLKSLGAEILAFIPGDEPYRGPIRQGLPTVEEHRKCDKRFAICELINAQTDMIIVGDPYVNEETQKILSDFQKGFVTLEAVVPEKLEGKVLCDRTDASDYVFRVLGTRGMELLSSKVSVKNRRVGEINQANEYYGRYQGEVEITKQVLPADKRQNVVGHILEKDTFLLPKLPEGYGIVLSKV
jgi:hypothetical protein